ncbi:MAG: histidinol dehydrogenase [Gammaproteobacteria bacterium]
MKIRRLDTADPRFDDELSALLGHDSSADRDIVESVRAIVDDVRRHGDAALIEYTVKFDRLPVAGPSDLALSEGRLRNALVSCEPSVRDALETAADRIRRYHERQQQASWSYREDDGTVLGQRWTAMDRVGVYVPGGKAAYPSSVLMNVIPAKVAGVNEIVMVVPAPEGKLEPIVLAAAAIAGVDRVFTVGGAQAIAALAYGTETIPRVDKIVGPGNSYVAAAKAAVFGEVGIDMIAGPSEVLIVADGAAPPEWMAMDLCAQAEHDERAQALLLSPDASYLQAVAASIERELPAMERASIIEAALSSRGALIKVRDIEEAIDLANRVAPEHLELALSDAEQWVPKVKHAGAIFVGPYAAEVLGDYCAGPNHVLPTGRTARFSSPLGVYDFQKRSSLIMCPALAASKLGRTAAVLARAEGLTAHARSAEYRILPER